MVFNFLA